MITKHSDAVLLVAILLVSAPLGGCRLFQDFDRVRPTSPRCEAGATASCPCPGGGTGIQRCTDAGQFGACQCGRDAFDGSDARTDVSKPDTASDAGVDPDIRPGDSDAGPDAGDADAGSEVSCPVGAGGLRVSRASKSPTIDAVCDDALYSGATVTFAPRGSNETGSNGSDNQGTCHLGWSPGSPSKIYGCCEIQDDVAIGPTKPSDPVENIWGENPNGPNDTISPDDRIEHHVRSDLDPMPTTGAAKYFLNNATSPGPARYANGFDRSGSRDFSFDGVREAAASRSNGQWTVEWAANLPFEPSPGSKALCEIVIFDVDEGTHDGKMMAFSPDGKLDSKSDWGCCLYE